MRPVGALSNNRKMSGTTMASVAFDNATKPRKAPPALNLPMAQAAYNAACSFLPPRCCLARLSLGNKNP